MGISRGGKAVEKGGWHWAGRTPSVVLSGEAGKSGVPASGQGGRFRGRCSWRDRGIDSGIDFRCHKPRPVDPGSALADLWFEIECEECLKDIEGEEGGQQEALDGIRFVLIDMVGVPGVGQFVEAMILDIPSLVAEGNGAPGGDKMERKRGDPYPVADEWLVFTVELPFHGMI